LEAGDFAEEMAIVAFGFGLSPNLISWDGTRWGIEPRGRGGQRGSGGIEGGRLNRGFVRAAPVGW
jgi:hypothetical protein